MSGVPEIKFLDRIIGPYVDGAELSLYESRYLTKPGDNYGSIMLAINAKIVRDHGSVEELPLIAKLPPLTNDLYWQLFQPERTCISENAVYKYLAPELEKLQLEVGVLPSKLFDGFSRYYGSRISLDEQATTVDRDAVLVQENLTVRGYRPGNRHKAYDLAHTVLSLHYLAKFHALPIALRLKKPETYNKFVRPYFKKFNMNASMSAEAKNVMNEENLADIYTITNNNEIDVKRVQELQELFDAYQESADVDDGPFTTIVHGDLWINNMMVKYDDVGVPTKLKIVDFQIAQYESLVHDLIFLFMSSVETSVLEQNYHNFLRIYHNVFIQTLREIAGVIDTNEYSYESFLAEVQRVAPIQIPHAIFMTKVIKADNKTIPDDFKDVDFTVLSKNKGVPEVMEKLSDIIKLAKKFNIFY
ncbi:uncharacterized protein LOC115628530 [Scaptodrosophila lebanonensis]|uniref:Uncharacterized protein LOC115628530 n=1 Tax=Drosophila lebanonensis TaxID=7225 RepID=A0A6J2TVH3_DROLE|nr:uncharacterized protein LOC115628530 [Scaptodrosophila lebanonensis]